MTVEQQTRAQTATPGAEEINTDGRGTGPAVPFEEKALAFLEKRHAEAGAKAEAEAPRDAEEDAEAEAEGEDDEQETEDGKKKRPSGAQRRKAKNQVLQEEVGRYKGELTKLATLSQRRVSELENQVAGLQAKLEYAERLREKTVGRFMNRGHFLEPEDEDALTYEQTLFEEAEKRRAAEARIQEFERREKMARLSQDQRVAAEAVRLFEGRVNDTARQYGFEGEMLSRFQQKVQREIRKTNNLDIDFDEIAETLAQMSDGAKWREYQQASGAQIARSESAPRSITGRSMTYTDAMRSQEPLRERMLRSLNARTRQ